MQLSSTHLISVKETYRLFVCNKTFSCLRATVFLFFLLVPPFGIHINVIYVGHWIIIIIIINYSHYLISLNNTQSV